MLEADEIYTFSDYIAALKRRLNMFAYVSLPLAAITFSLALLLPDSFESFARIDIDLEGADVEILEPIVVSNYADQYIAKLRQRVLTADSLSILVQDDSLFSSALGDLSDSDRRKLIHKGVFVSIITQTVTAQSGRGAKVISGFKTGFKGPDPEFARHVAVFMSETFQKEDRATRTERANSTSTFLREQMHLTEEEIVVLEKRIADFKVKNACCLPELKELNMLVIQRAERDIENLQPRVRTLEQDRIFLQAQLEEIRKQSVATDRLSVLEEQYIGLVANYGPDHPDVAKVRREISAIINIGTLEDGGQELLDLRVELAKKEHRYSDIHPDVIGLKRRIAALEADKPATEQRGRERLLDNPRYLQLRSEINAIDTELKTLRTRSPELRRKIEEYEDRLIRTPQIESEYQAVNRKLETARENYDNLQNRLVIARQTQALESTEIGARLTEMVSPYVPRAPSGPPRLAILILGLFVAVSLGLAAVILTELMDTTIRGSKDIIRTLQLAPIASIPIVQDSTSLATNRHRMIKVMGATVLLIVAAIFVFTSAAG